MNSGNVEDPSRVCLQRAHDLLFPAGPAGAVHAWDALDSGCSGFRLLQIWAALDLEHCSCLLDQLWPYGSCSAVVFVPWFDSSWCRERGRLRRQLCLGKASGLMCWLGNKSVTFKSHLEVLMPLQGHCWLWAYPNPAVNCWAISFSIWMARDSNSRE